MSQEFPIRELNHLGREKQKAASEAFEACLAKVTALCPTGRELAIVRTKLQEAFCFVEKAIESSPENVEGGN